MGSWIRITLISLAVLGTVVMTFNLRAGLLRLSGYSTSDDGELMLPHIKEAIEALSSRVCGSPAVDGYAHVVPECLETSPTTVYWRKWMREGGTPESLVAHIEEHADYDGLAVGWGIGQGTAAASWDGNMLMFNYLPIMSPPLVFANTRRNGDMPCCNCFRDAHVAKGNTKSSAEECAEACRNHKPGPHVGGAHVINNVFLPRALLTWRYIPCNKDPKGIFTTMLPLNCATAKRLIITVRGPFGLLPCNAFAVCLPAEGNVCFAPDAHTHSRGDCWLKFTEGPANPEVNFRGKLSHDFKKRHPNAPDLVQWHAGVLLPPGLRPTNGTWSPRYSW